MAPVILITGGSRSGKSAFAQQMAEQIEGPRLFVATCPHTDPEMDDRIRRHCRDRQGRGWQSVEESLLLVEQLGNCRPGSTVLIDCLTLWINNLMFAAGEQQNEIDEDLVAQQAEKLGQAAIAHQGTVIMVTNEVGLGIVPDNRMARLYRDLVGRCNQVVATKADQVFLVSCGIPLQIK